MKKSILIGAIFLVLLTGVVFFSGSPSEPSSESVNASTFNGVRAQIDDAVYIENDFDSGLEMRIEAKKARFRDGKFGKLFRTPLKQKVELKQVQVELKDAADRSLLHAEADEGIYRIKKKIVILKNPNQLSIQGYEIIAQSVSIRPDGNLEINNSYQVLHESKKLGEGRNFREHISKFVPSIR